MAEDNSIHPSAAPPSGQWAGYYLYTPGGVPHGQVMRATFAGGRIEGDGDDDIGQFTVSGAYSVGSGVAAWTKTYLGAHSVEYKGYFERGAIWGVWRIIAPASSGGFKLWPITGGPETQASREERIDSVSRDFGEALARSAERQGISLQEALNQAFRQPKPP